MKEGEYSMFIPEITLKYKKGNVEKITVKTSQESADVMRKFFDADTIDYTESCICLFLNRILKTIGWFKLSQGGIAGTVIDAKVVCVTALKCGASGVIMAHNHPSGDCKPSENDKKITEKVKEALKAIDIELVDHLVIGENTHYSFADDGLL